MLRALARGWVGSGSKVPLGVSASKFRTLSVTPNCNWFIINHYLVQKVCIRLVEGSTGNPRRLPYGSQKHILLFPLQRLSFRRSSWVSADSNHVINKFVRGKPSREKIECALSLISCLLSLKAAMCEI